MHKIALSGFGRISRVIYSGTDIFCYSKPVLYNETKLDLQIFKNSQDCLSLVKSYRKVKQKYFPEMDVVILGRK